MIDFKVYNYPSFLYGGDYKMLFLDCKINSKMKKYQYWDLGSIGINALSVIITT